MKPRALRLERVALVSVLAVVLLSLAFGAVLPGCPAPPVPVCEPSSTRCGGPDRVEVCTPEGQWIVGDRCGDFGPGAWECRAWASSPRSLS